MTFIEYGPDVSPAEYERRLAESRAELAASLRKDFGRRDRPTPASMPKKKRGKR